MRWADRLRLLPKALASDAPWSDCRSRWTPLFSLLIAGTIAGALEGLVLRKWIYGDEFYNGDAFVWDWVEHFAFVGCAVGSSSGIALSISRNLFTRVSLAGLLGTLGVAMALRVYSGGEKIYLCGSMSSSAEGLLFPTPEGWGLYLGSVSSAILSVVAHFFRRCARKVKLLVLLLPLGTLLSMRGESWFWSQWSSFHYPDWGGCGNGAPRIIEPLDVGALLFVPTTFLMIVVVELMDSALRRIGRSRLLPRALGSTAGALLATLIWAGSAMPCTATSATVTLSATLDPSILITAHRGETFRLWKIEEGDDPNEPQLTLHHTYRFRRGPIRYFAYALTSTLAAAGSEDGQICIWSIPSFQLLLHLRTGPLRIATLALSPDGRFLAAGNTAPQIRLWELHLDDPDEALRAKQLPSLTDKENNRYFHFQFASNGTELATVQEPSTLCIRGVPSLAQRLKLQDQRFHWITPPIVSKDSRCIAVGVNRATSVAVFELQAHRTRILTLTSPHGQPVTFSPDARQLVLSGDDRLWIVDYPSGTTLGTVYDPSDKHLAVYSSDGRWIVWQRDSPKISS